MADLGRPDLEILGGLLIILRQQSKRHFQIVLPRQVGQLPEMVCSVATVGNLDHPRETARPVNRSHSAACARLALIRIKFQLWDLEHIRHIPISGRVHR